MKTVTAYYGDSSWIVSVDKRPDGIYEVTGRASLIEVFVRPSHGGYLMAMPNIKRAGQIPVPPTGEDVCRYCDVDSLVDGVTIAAAIRVIADERRGVRSTAEEMRTDG